MRFLVMKGSDVVCFVEIPEAETMYPSQLYKTIYRNIRARKFDDDQIAGFDIYQIGWTITGTGLIAWVKAFVPKEKMT